MTTSILTRRTHGNTPAVFLLDTLNLEGKTIQMWNPDTNAEPQTVSLDLYKMTRPTSDADEEFMIRRFSEKFSPQGGVVLRKRLFKVSPDHPSYVAKETSHHEPVLHSVANLQAQQREASPESAMKPRITVEEWNKAAFVDRVMNAFTKALAEALKEAMK